MGYVSQDFRTRFQAEAKKSFLLHLSYWTGIGPPSGTMRPGALSSVLKWPGREANTRSYTSLPLRVHGVTLS